MATTVLIIEDEKSIRTMYSEILKEEGYEVLEAGDGESGLEAVLNGTWDILLLDIMLPKLDGVELLRKVQDNPKTKDKPIIVLTNLEDEVIKANCLKLGAKEFFVKSNIVPGDLVLTIKKYVFQD